jgi:hypothetical protein
MQVEPMFIITKSGLTIRPETIDLLRAYTTRYINDSRKMLDEYIAETHCTSFDDPIFAEAQREICRAVEVVKGLDQVGGHIVHVYDRNFETWAGAFRQARIERGLAKIEDSPDLYALLRIVMAILKAENPKFSEEKFRKFINNDTEDPIITR